MNPPPSSPDPAASPESNPSGSSRRVIRLFIGMLAGNAIGILPCLLGAYLLSSEDARAGWLGPFVALPSLLLVPVIIGFVATFVWRPLDLGIGMTMAHSVTCTVIGLVSAGLFLGEGIICLIILSPILFVGVIAGALIGRLVFRRKKNNLVLCFAPLAILALVEPGLREPHTGAVIDEIRISAPPARVWPHVLAFDEIPDAPDYWLFRAGLPYPTMTTNGGNFVGASRACHFSGGAVFEEKVAEFVPGKRLAFDIVKSPPDPELIGHLDAYRGQFELRDNGDGSTTLIGTTWYSLQVRPAWYFDWWTRDIFRAVHLRVMNNIKRLAERGS